MMDSSCSLLLMRDSLLPNPIKTPGLLSIPTTIHHGRVMKDGLLPNPLPSIHGVSLHHQPLSFTGEYVEEDNGRSKRPKGWALWEEGVSMNSIREVEEEGRGKKIKRLKAEQVRALEASFEEEKKLEPEKKQELALQLGLQPRQVAIWFQNRRARSKSKQIELDFALLSSHYRSLLVETHRLKSEVARLTKELDNARREPNAVPHELSRKGILKEEDIFKEASFKDEVLGILIQDKMNVVNYMKESSSTCSTYSVIVDAESSTSMSHKEISAYECSSLEDLEHSCLSHGWNEDNLLVTHESTPYTTLQPQDLVLDEPCLTNTMIHATMDWLWELTT